MKNDYLVTIAIPTYNGTYLKEAIQSAVNQTYKNIEIVIVNDCSPHDITPIVDSFKDDRIRYYVNEKNIGGKDLVAQWNKCLSLAKGHFFCLLCDDDIYDPQFVEVLLNLTERYPNVDVFRARAAIIDKDGHMTDIYPSSPEYEAVYDYMWQKWKGTRYQTISEILVKTSRAREVGGYVSLPRAWGSDSISVFLFGMQNGIASTTHILTRFRMSGENISSNFKKDSREKMLAAQLYREKIYEIISGCQDADIKMLLLKYERTEHQQRVLNILKRCSLKDFIWIICHYHIKLKLVLKACCERMIKTLSSGCKWL